MTAKQTVPEVTADGILKALSSGAKSLTGVAKLLGYKSGSSATLKKITQIVPDIMDRLAINPPKAVKAGKKAKAVPEKKPAVKKPASDEYPMPDITPYRHSPEKPSGYAKIFSILFAFKGTGISHKDLLSKYMAWSKKPEKNARFDIQVVCSAREDGSCNRSAGKASQSYWVERQNAWFKLHLIGEDKK